MYNRRYRRARGVNRNVPHLHDPLGADHARQRTFEPQAHVSQRRRQVIDDGDVHLAMKESPAELTAADGQ